MSSKHLAGKQIQQIEVQGLWYIDDDGTEQFIDFTTCYENYVQESLSPDVWEKSKQLNNQSDADWEDYVERIRRFKYIGERNILTPPWGDGPYIEFYTTPPTRFKFETETKYREARTYIETNGWRTSDRS
jgi:hypothetical protein